MKTKFNSIRDAEAERIANQYAQPVIRSMYPSLSRGEMARKFKEVFSFGFEYRDKLDNEALKVAVEALEKIGHQATTCYCDVESGFFCGACHKEEQAKEVLYKIKGLRGGE